MRNFEKRRNCHSAKGLRSFGAFKPRNRGRGYNCMNAVALISEFERHGIRLSVEAGRILARPKGATPADLAEQARAHKADLVALLSAPAISHVSENELDRLARADGWRPPKEIPPSIVAEIQR